MHNVASQQPAAMRTYACLGSAMVCSTPHTAWLAPTMQCAGHPSPPLPSACAARGDARCHPRNWRHATLATPCGPRTSAGCHADSTTVRPAQLTGGTADWGYSYAALCPTALQACVWTACQHARVHCLPWTRCTPQAQCPGGAVCRPCQPCGSPRPAAGGGTGCGRQDR